MRSTSVAHTLNFCQSAFGAPSNSQMIGIGYGSHTSRTNSVLPDFVDGSIRPLMTSRMKGRNRSALRGENACATSLRNLTWVSPSAFRMLTRRRARNFSSVTPASCAANPTALCHRLSRRTLVTVS